MQNSYRYLWKEDGILITSEPSEFVTRPFANLSTYSLAKILQYNGTQQKSTIAECGND